MVQLETSDFKVDGLTLLRCGSFKKADVVKLAYFSMYGFGDLVVLKAQHVRKDIFWH